MKIAFVFVVAALGLVSCAPSSAPAPKDAAAPVAPAAPAAPSWTPYAGSDKILVTDAAKQSVTVNLVAAEGDALKGMNFNGYGNGTMQIQVPTGWTVKASLTVGGGSLSHSALLVPWDQRTQSGKWTLAFPHAAVADYQAGMEAGDSPQTFKITATTAGQYGLICGVPGHVAMGMWDEFDVVDGLAAPQVLVQN